MFSPNNASDYGDDLLQLARITALLGPRPQELARGRKNSMFFAPDGKYGLAWARG